MRKAASNEKNQSRLFISISPRLMFLRTRCRPLRRTPGSDKSFAMITPAGDRVVDLNQRRLIDVLCITFKL